MSLCYSFSEIYFLFEQQEPSEQTTESKTSEYIARILSKRWKMKSLGSLMLKWKPVSKLHWFWWKQSSAQGLWHLRVHRLKVMTPSSTWNRFSFILTEQAKKLHSAFGFHAAVLLLLRECSKKKLSICLHNNVSTCLYLISSYKSSYHQILLSCRYRSLWNRYREYFIL